MKIHFYGTSASEGFPSPFCECEFCKRVRREGGKNIRTRSSCQIDDNILIDFSADTFAHTVYGGLQLTQIDYLLISHAHPDHFYPEDIAAILPPMGQHFKRHKLNVFGNEDVGRILKQTVENYDNYMQYLVFNEVHSFEKIQINDYEMIPLKANHKEQEECLLYIIRDGKKTLLYGLDSGEFCEETWDRINQYYFDCVVLDCTSVDKREFFKGHMGFEENIEVKERMIKSGAAGSGTIFVSTHFAHSFAPFHQRLTDKLQPYGFVAAYDGLDIEF